MYNVLKIYAKQVMETSGRKKFIYMEQKGVGVTRKMHLSVSKISSRSSSLCTVKCDKMFMTIAEVITSDAEIRSRLVPVRCIVYLWPLFRVCWTKCVLCPFYAIEYYRQNVRKNGRISLSPLASAFILESICRCMKNETLVFDAA